MGLRTDDRGQLCRIDNTACGRLAPRDVKLLSLFKNEGVEYDLLWVPSSEVPTGQSGTLWVTIYGDKALAKDLGDALQDVEVYLQDPIHAERNAIYWNPQRFHHVEGLRTISLKDNMGRSYPEAERLETVDVLRHFTSEDNLPETEGSVSLSTQLKRWDSHVSTSQPELLHPSKVDIYLIQPSNESPHIHASPRTRLEARYGWKRYMVSRC